MLSLPPTVRVFHLPQANEHGVVEVEAAELAPILEGITVGDTSIRAVN